MTSANETLCEKSCDFSPVFHSSHSGEAPVLPELLQSAASGRRDRPESSHIIVTHQSVTPSRMFALNDDVSVIPASVSGHDSLPNHVYPHITLPE